MTTTTLLTTMGALDVNEIEAGIVDHTMKVVAQLACSHVVMELFNQMSTAKILTPVMATVAAQCVQWN